MIWVQLAERRLSSAFPVNEEEIVMLASIGRRLSIPAALICALGASASGQTHMISTADGSSVLTVRQDPVLGMVVESLGDAADPTAVMFAPLDLWQLEFKKGAACILIGPSQLSSADVTFLPLANKVTIEWDDATSALLPGEEFTVEVELEANESTGEFEGKIHVLTSTPQSSLYRVRFPRLETVVEGTPPAARLAAPFLHGVLLPDPVHNVTLVGASKLNAALPACSAVNLVEPGNVSMQWWSLYDSSDANAPGFFFGTHDELGYRKEWMFDTIAVAPGADRLRLILRHVPTGNLTPNNDYAQPYPFVLRVVRGDWYDAARHYRQWALHQPWTAQGPMGENPDFSSLALNAKMYGVTQVPQEGPNDPATFCPLDPSWAKWAFWPPETASQRATFDVNQITPRVFFWDFNSFARDVGDWFPIQAAFIAAATILRAQGDDYSAYFTTLVYSSRVPSFTSSYVPKPTGGTYGPVEPWGIKRENLLRSFQTRTICPTAPVAVSFLDLCQATAFTGDYAAYVARRLYTEAGARGLYLDVLSGTDVQLCYDSTHGHPVGGGFYYTKGIQDVFASVLDEMRLGTTPVPQYFLESEGAGERFLPWIDTVHPQLTWTRTQTFCDVFTGQCPRNGTDFLVTPLYDVVYNDFQLTSATLQLAAPRNAIGPVGLPILADPFFMRMLRNLFSAHVALGWEPFAGSILSADLTASNANPALFPDYFRLTDMVRRYMDVLELPTVRDFVVLGPRLRDPVLAKAAPGNPPLTSVPFDTFPFAHNWLANGRRQPLVYGSVYGRLGSVPPGDELTAEQHDELGILLQNWSDATDNTFFLINDGGDQGVLLTFDPAEYTQGATQYSIYLVDPTGETLIQSGAVAGPVSTTITVPARTAVFLRVVLTH